VYTCHLTHYARTCHYILVKWVDSLLALAYQCPLDVLLEAVQEAPPPEEEEEEVNIDQRDNDDCTPLHVAILNGQLDAMQVDGQSTARARSSVCDPHRVRAVAREDPTAHC
jgi:hypothetical protein